MKIPKIFAGLAVCSALIFPGALSSSAQEINPSVSLQSDKYLVEQESELVTTNSTIPNSIYVSKAYLQYGGHSFTHYEYGIGPASATLYKGTLTFQYQEGIYYYYSGTLYKVK